MTPYTITINEDACWGCKTCEVACKQEMNVPEDIRLIAVSEDGPRVADGKPIFLYRVNLCRHCEEPACVEACPEEVITQRPDGVVILDETACSGCRACMDSCPYDAITFDENRDQARKCNLCHHRIDKGLIPACADNVCLAHCIYFNEIIP